MFTLSKAKTAPLQRFVARHDERRKAKIRVQYEVTYLSYLFMYGGTANPPAWLMNEWQWEHLQRSGPIDAINVTPGRFIEHAACMASPMTPAQAAVPITHFALVGG